jgi:hypothetical protein
MVESTTFYLVSILRSHYSIAAWRWQAWNPPVSQYPSAENAPAAAQSGRVIPLFGVFSKEKYYNFVTRQRKWLKVPQPL